MAFNTNALPAEYIASSGQTEFPFLFKVFKNTDLLVYKTNNGQVADDSTDLLTLGVQYTVSITGDTGGSVTLLTAQSLGDRITIIRNLSITRDTEYQNNGDLLSSTLNEDQDYQTYLLGDINRQLLKTLRFSSSSQGLNGSLPSPLPEQYIRWNSSGTALENDTEFPFFIQLAKDWANKAEDVIVADLEYSSKHYSIKATAQADIATTQAGIATTQANLAISAFDSFDDRYLGAKASAPTLDNDGNALLTGALYYDSTFSKMNVYTGSMWKEASSAVQGIQASQVYTATASQTVFNINYDVGYVNVYVNGLRLAPSDFTATNGTSITLAVGATLGDTVECLAFGTFELANAYTKAEANALLGSKVSKIGDETIAGIKTFSPSPVVPTPTTDMQVANKSYVDSKITFDYSETTNPTATTNPTRGQGATWINKATGVIFVCKIATTNQTFWLGTDGTSAGYTPVAIFDVFGDNSATALYQFDGNANDTGGVFNGTVTAGTASYPTGKFNQAFSINTGKLDLGTKTLVPSGIANWSFSCWYKRNGTDRNTLCARANSATSYGLTFSHEVNKTFQIQFPTSTSTQVNIVTSAITTFDDGNFHHVVFSVKKQTGNAYMYIDNVLVYTATTVPTSDYDNNLNVLIGAFHNANYAVTIDQARFFNRTLTALEVQTLYQETQI